MLMSLMKTKSAIGVARSQQFRQVLIDGDVAGLRALWSTHFAHLPQPADDGQAEIMLHRARTEAGTVPFRTRAWSHRWLVERGLPSGLPDDLRPRAERLWPRRVETVGISVNAGSAVLRPLLGEVQRAMEAEVLELYTHSASPDPALVRARLAAARAETLKKLGARDSDRASSHEHDAPSEWRAPST